MRLDIELPTGKYWTHTQYNELAKKVGLINPTWSNKQGAMIKLFFDEYNRRCTDEKKRVQYPIQDL